jgi:hypothetical protein
VYREDDDAEAIEIRKNVLSPVSPNPYGDEEGEEGEQASALVPIDDSRPQRISGSGEWRSRVEKALAKMTTEVAALREQLESNRMRRRKGRAKEIGIWVLKILWTLLRHLAVEAVFWGLVFLWMKKRGDRRAEEALKMVMRFVRERLKEMGFRKKR